MAQKNLLRRHSKESSQNYGGVSATGRILFTLGVCIMLISLVYMVFNLSMADAIVDKWLIAMVSGIGIITAGLAVDFINSMNKGKNKE
ncbi:MAG: hypothetical protein E6772_07835 [Dysgonomonas sp.]|nr:hypothetical protein [Dysgonomonas sp.]